MTGFFAILAAFLRREFRIATSYKFQFVFQLVNSFFAVAIFYFLSQLMGEKAAAAIGQKYDVGYFAFILVGVAGTTFVETAMSGFTVRLRQTMTEGSLEAMFATGVRPLYILAMPSVWSFLFDGARALGILMVGAWIFGADLSHANWLSWTVVVLAAAAAYSVFGLLSLVFIMTLKRGDPVTWAVTQATAVVGGAYFPLSLLPDWLETAARLLPMTYAFEAMRGALLAGAPVGALQRELITLVAFAVVGLPIAVWLCHRAVDRAKRDGSLGTF